MTSDQSDDRQALYRAVIVVICIAALLSVVYMSLGWDPGGILVDDKNKIIKDAAGNFVRRPRVASDVVAIVGAVTTFLGTALGTYFGINVGSQATRAANATAQTATDVAKLATTAAQQSADTAQKATSAAQSATDAAADAAKDATAVKLVQDEAVKSLLTSVHQATPHVAAVDQTLADTIVSKIKSLDSTLR